MTDIKRGRCYRCNMGYRIEKPFLKGRRPEFARCRDCHLQFWHGNRVIDGEAVIVIGVDPVDYEAFHSGRSYPDFIERTP